jgi:hypothetical protein
MAIPPAVLWGRLPEARTPTSASALTTIVSAVLYGTTPVVQPHPLRRTAGSDMRQSTGHPGLTTIERPQLQRAMREQAHHLGWPDARLASGATARGQTAPSTPRRGGSQARLADVALGPVGIVLSSERTRLSRHCTAWDPLLALCASQPWLMADRDGV